MVSRETYAIADRMRNFYMQGSMGCALGFGLGIAYKRPDLNVVVIAGDGEILMGLGSVVLMNHLGLKNIKLYILDNNCHASTGGQKTCSDSLNLNTKNIKTITISNEKGDAPRIPLSCKKIKVRFKNAVSTNNTLKKH